MNLQQPLVSVIIPCYNVSTFVETAITSILKQTYTHLEIWIIDDASTDNTLEKINGFKDERIKVVALKQNTKKVGAVNQVLQQVIGDLICFQDADDRSELDRIEKQVKRFELETELGVCFTKCRYVGDKSSIPNKVALSNEELRIEFLDFNYKRSAECSPTICGTMMISKRVLQETSGYHPYFAGRVAEDIHWVYRILKRFKGITVNDVLYNYTVRKSSFTDLQFSGGSAKYAYSWQLVSRIIYKDIHENVDLLDPKNLHELKAVELEACEEALIEKIVLLKETQRNYENSTSFKIGKLILNPLHQMSIWRASRKLKN